MTGGLGATDIEPLMTIGGLFRRLILMIRDEYLTRLGETSDDFKLCNDGYHFTPSVAERCFDALVAEQPGITLQKGWRLAWTGGTSILDGGRWVVETATGAGPNDPGGVPERRVTAAVLERVDSSGRATGEQQRVAASVFVDATYEGDVALGAGATYRIGREGREEYGESHAGVIYQDFRSKLCYPSGEGGGVDGRSDPTGVADRRVQAYNYRLCLTREPKNRLPIARPARYDRARYATLVEDVRTGRIPVVRAPRGGPGLLNLVALPDGKTNVNNQHYCFVSTDWPEENYDYPEAGPERRLAIAEAHREYTEGLLWFAQHDPELPEAFRLEASEWGWAADEFADNNGFPYQLYVREAARIAGDYVFASRDAILAADGGRAPVHWDSVAAGGYQIDSHATRKREDVDLPPTKPGEIPDGRLVALEGFIGIRPGTVPYQLPYRIMLPLGIDALLVPGAVSATHLGFGTIRMEPTWMALGEAAGTAAAMAVRGNVRVRDVPRALLQQSLLDHGAVITYFGDVPPADFPGHEAYPEDLSAAAQFWGTRGFFATYEVKPNDPLSAGEAERWLWLVRREIDPWRTITLDRAALAADQPLTWGAFTQRLRAAVEDPSPLRRSLGAPPLPPQPADPSASVSRGDACRLLYQLYGELI